MSSELCPVRPLFGGAISSAFPLRFQDVSNIRQVPDHQEVFADPSRDESLIVELLDFKPDAISKGRQGREAQNLVRVYVANIRLKGVATDVLVTAYEPIPINPLSESAVDVGAGLAVPASQSGIMPMCDVIKQSLSTFKVNDWSLFGSSV